MRRCSCDPARKESAWLLLSWAGEANSEWSSWPWLSSVRLLPPGPLKPRGKCLRLGSERSSRTRRIRTASKRAQRPGQDGGGHPSRRVNACHRVRGAGKDERGCREVDKLLARLNMDREDWSAARKAWTEVLAVWTPRLGKNDAASHRGARGTRESRGIEPTSDRNRRRGKGGRTNRFAGEGAVREWKSQRSRCIAARRFRHAKGACWVIKGPIMSSVFSTWESPQSAGQYRQSV